MPNTLIQLDTDHPCYATQHALQLRIDDLKQYEASDACLYDEDLSNMLEPIYRFSSAFYYDMLLKSYVAILNEEIASKEEAINWAEAYEESLFGIIRGDDLEYYYDRNYY